jgi:nitrogen fixation protein NifB
MAKDSAIKVVAVAGPGEPLANEETFEALNMAKEFFPGLIRCIATNGLLLSERAQRLEHLGVATVTVTVNAVDPAIGSHIYDYVRINGEAYYGQKAAEVLIDRQYQGVKEVISRGMAVKINTVLIPGINGDHMVEVARRYAGLDIHVMNITPLIPVGKFAEMRPPTHQELSVARRECGRYIKQFTKCKQYRADACGIPGGQDGLLARPCL